MRERQQHREFCGGRLVQVVTQQDLGFGLGVQSPQWRDYRHHWILDGRRVDEAEALTFRESWGE